MPWNDQNPQNNPWGNKPGQQPPDLDEVVRRLQQRLSGMFGGGGGSGGGGISGPGKGVVMGGIVLALVLWVASGIYMVAADEEAVVLRFGKFVATTGPGLNWHLPYPVESVEKVPVTRVQRLEVGFRNLPGGRGRQVPQEALMLTKDENIVDVSFIVQYKVKDVANYVFNVAHTTKAVRDAAESAIREVIGRTMVDDVLTTGKAAVEVEVEGLIQSILNSYKVGILVTAVKLQNVQPPERVIKEFKDVASAREDRARAKNVAEAYANDILPKARGQGKKIVLDAQAYAASVVDRAQGESKRFVALLVAYRSAPDVTRKRLYIEAMEDILSRVDKIIVDKSVAARVLPYLPLDSMRGKVEVK
ncbi:MAG: FtsH protease activity modulator HflK [Mariprofundaceae bacterium]|nr:FtsH protease activity modulator HflK [Mariprofundaceae bacterium]